MLQMANVFIFFRFMEDKKTLIHFCTRMSKIHLCVLRVLCGELLSSTQRQPLPRGKCKDRINTFCTNKRPFISCCSVFFYIFAESERKSDKLPGQAYIIINKKRKPYQLHPKKRKSPKISTDKGWNSMMLLLLYVCAPLQKGAHIYTISVGCLFSSFISLVFGDTTYSMFLSKSFYEFNICLTSVNLAL